MNCSNCHQPVEIGAAFCGNCGQALQPTALDQSAPAQVVSPISVVMQNSQAPGTVETVLPVAPLAVTGVPAVVAGVPSYALANPAQHSGETKALLALLFGIGGLIGCLFMALLGLAFGIGGIVMGTMSRSSTKRGLSTAGIIVSSLALVSGLAVWAYTFNHASAVHRRAAASSHAPSVAAADLSTPCYSVGFVDTLNVSNSSGSCTMNAYNGSTLSTSTNAYKVYANKAPIKDEVAFNSVAKTAVDKDIKDSLPGFSVDSEQAARFAGSPAYILHATDKVHNIAIVEAAVLHKTATTDNVFILVHVTVDKTANLNTMEAQWQWK